MLNNFVVMTVASQPVSPTRNHIISDRLNNFRKSPPLARADRQACLKFWIPVLQPLTSPALAGSFQMTEQSTSGGPRLSTALAQQDRLHCRSEHCSLSVWYSTLLPKNCKNSLVHCLSHTHQMTQQGPHLLSCQPQLIHQAKVVSPNQHSQAQHLSSAVLRFLNCLTCNRYCHSSTAEACCQQSQAVQGPAWDEEG